MEIEACSPGESEIYCEAAVRRTGRKQRIIFGCFALAIAKWEKQTDRNIKQDLQSFEVTNSHENVNPVEHEKVDLPKPKYIAKQTAAKKTSRKFLNDSSDG